MDPAVARVLGDLLRTAAQDAPDAEAFRYRGERLTYGDWAVRTYARILAGQGSAVDLEILDRIQDGLQNGRCLCGLGDSAGWVIMSTMRYFRGEYEEHCLRNECSAERLEVAASA